jgi:predicted Ser/Thr protein kinase
MNALSNPQLAMIGVWEILILLIVMGVAATVIVAIVVIAIKLANRKLKPVPSVPPTQKVEEANCPRCGTPLGPGVAKGLCPRCVLAAGFETQGETNAAKPSTPDTAETPKPAELAAHFPHLEIADLIGRGGMGWVFKARQKNLDRVVALKVLPPVEGKDPAFAERFQREARALARLNHPNIVAIYDFGQAGPYYYFMMEFVEGPNLRQLERARRLSPEEAFAIVPKICEALQYAHDEGIVHRDIKPENILVDQKGRVKIADFGIAKIVGLKQDITLTGTQHTLGTPHYMAPEQIEAPNKVDHRADIYALGVVFYEMLTGELPMGRFEPPSKKLQVDVRVDEVVLKSLERNPEKRYQTVGAVKTDVEGITSGIAASDPAVTSPEPAVQRRDAPPLTIPAELLMLVAAIAILVSVGVGVWLLFRGAFASANTRFTLTSMSACLAVYGLLIGAVSVLLRRLRARILCLLITTLIGIVAPLALGYNVVDQFQHIPQWPVGIPFWLGVPLMVWVVVLLFRSDVRDAFKVRERKMSASRTIAVCPDGPSLAQGASASTSNLAVFSIVGRAWHDWWAERAKWFTLSVQIVLVIAHLFCLSAFFGTTMKSIWDKNDHRQFTYTVGAGDPWFTYKTYPIETTPFQFGIYPFAGSMLFLIAGFAIYYFVWRIEKVRHPRAGFWCSPTPVAILWGLWAVCAISMGMFFGQSALKEERLSGPFAPQLRSAIEIRSVDQRDEALRKVALQAAAGDDAKTVNRALEEIRGNEFHDQTAADCALELAKLNKHADATAVARKIRTSSLHDKILERIASGSATNNAPARQ